MAPSAGTYASVLHQVPEALRTEPRQRVLDLDGAAQAEHIRIRIRTRDAGPAGVSGPVIQRLLLVAVAIAVSVGALVPLDDI